MQTRRQAFKNYNEEYQKVLEVCLRYAIHYAGRNVSFNCKKSGSTTSDLHTPNDGSIIDAIRLAYGNHVAKELLELKYDADDGQNAIGVSFSGYVSNPNHANKKPVFILFINDRLVEASAIKRLVDSVYADFLPKHTHPFVYLSIKMPPENIDVNVHPTKKEVHFMNEDALLELIDESVKKLLGSANSSRTFYTQSVLSGFQPLYCSSSGASSSQVIAETISISVDAPGNTGDNSLSSASLPGIHSYDISSKEVMSLVEEPPSKVRKAQPLSQPPANKMIRTDHSLVKIDSVFRPRVAESKSTQSFSMPSHQEKVISQTSTVNSVPHNVVGAFAKNCLCCVPGVGGNHSQESAETQSTAVRAHRFLPIAETSCQFTSIQSLLDAIKSSENKNTTNVLKKCIFVGMLDQNFSIVQVTFSFP